MQSLSLRLMIATTFVFMASLSGAFALLVQEAKYGLFRVQRNSLTVQVDELAERIRLVEGKPALDLGNFADHVGKTVSYALLDTKGRVLQSFGLPGVDVSPAVIERFDTDDPFGFSIERWLDPNSGDPVMLILPDSSGAQRIVVTLTARDGLMVQASMPLINSNVAIADILYTFTEGTVLAVLLPLIFAIIAIPIIVRLTMKPVRRVSRQAEAIGAATLDRRLSVDRVPSEMRGLVLAFNGLLGRLDAAWRLQREFTANAAHELRTPIAALRAEVEAMLPGPKRSALAIHFDKVARLLAQLLALAEADSRPVDAASHIDLTALAKSVVADMAPAVLASGREIAIEQQDGGPTTVRGDAGLAEIALRNLIDNAARHSRPGSAIRVVVDEARILVANTGSDIPDAVKKAMFERFWKKERRTSGSGLGLSIVDTVMKRLDGHVEVSSAEGLTIFKLDFQHVANI